MITRDISQVLEAAETPETRAYEHALDIEFMILGIMKDRGISKKELAEKMGVSAPHLSKLLNSQPNMTLGTIAKFEMALDVKFDFAFEEDSDMMAVVYETPVEYKNNAEVYYAWVSLDEENEEGGAKMEYEYKPIEGSANLHLIHEVAA